jgi:hypothetical protein
MRDANPSTEAATFCRLTYALLEFSHRNPGVNRGELFRFLISVVNGNPIEVNPPSLLEEVGSLLSHAPESLGDVTNFTEDGYFTAGPAHLR